MIELQAIEHLVSPVWPPAYGKESIARCQLRVRASKWSRCCVEQAYWDKTLRAADRMFERWAERAGAVVNSPSVTFLDGAEPQEKILAIGAWCISDVPSDRREHAQRFLSSRGGGSQPLQGRQWQTKEEQRSTSYQRWQSEERQQQRAKLCKARTDSGQCGTPGVVRTNPADGADLGRLCMRHFRQQYPALAPPPPSKQAKPPACWCGFEQRWKTWTYCPGCGERLLGVGEAYPCTP